MISQEFLSNAKLFSNGINNDRMWLVDCDKKIAVVCPMDKFLVQDFTRLEEPTKETYADFLELIRREINFLGVDSNGSLYLVRSQPQKMTLVNQVAVQFATQQLLEVAKHQLASIILVNAEKWDYAASSTSAVPRPEFTQLALAYAEQLIAETKKKVENS